MTDSMISFVVGLAVVLVLAIVMARRYMRDHKDEGLSQWLDAHHTAVVKVVVASTIKFQAAFRSW